MRYECAKFMESDNNNGLKYVSTHRATYQAIKMQLSTGGFIWDGDVVVITMVQLSIMIGPSPLLVVVSYLA